MSRLHETPLRAPAAAALALALLGSCGLINGLQGSSGQPSNGGTPLSALGWHGPVQLDQGTPASADSPRLAWGQGTAWVTFYEFNAGLNRADAWVTRRPAGGSFAAPQQIPPVEGWDGGGAYPQIAVGHDGVPALALQEWQLGSGGIVTASSIWGARLSNGLALSSSDLTRLDNAGSNTPQLTQQRALAVDGAGNVLVAWEEGTGFYVNGISSGETSWSGPIQIDSSSSGYWSTVDVVGGPAGDIFATWASTSQTQAAAVSLFGTPMAGVPKTLISGSNTQGATVAMRDTSAMAAFVSSGGISTINLINGIWGSVQTIADTHLSYYAGLSLAINSSGQAVLIWRDAGGSDSYGGTLQAAFYDGIVWSAPQTISPPISSPRAWWAKVDINDTGSAIAAWADFDPTSTYTRIYVNILEFGSGTPTWQGPTPIDQPSPDAGLAGVPENVRYVGVALDPAGSSAHVIWMQHDNNTAETAHTWANWLE